MRHVGDKGNSLAKAIFLDRDGVINKKAPGDGYVTRWQDFELLPDVAEAISQINRAGLAVIVITNQRCIAKGLMTVDDLEDIHQQMREFLEKRGARIDAIYYCPHETDPACHCRKPAPGMFERASHDYGIQLTVSWMIGDSDIDIEAGKNAGCKTALLLGTGAGASVRALNRADLVTSSLQEAVRLILTYEQSNAGSKVNLPTALGVSTGASR